MGHCVISSHLSHDINDDDLMDRIWGIISNREIVAVNQGYFGDSGGIYDVSNEKIVLQQEKYKTEVPVYQYLSKPLGVNKVAMLLINSDMTQHILNATFADIPGLGYEIDSGKEYLARDMWAHEHMGAFQNSISVSVKSHDASFLLIEKSDDSLGIIIS